MSLVKKKIRQFIKLIFRGKDMNNINEKIQNMNNLVELHLHLDGALSLDNCKKLAKIQNIDISNVEEILNFITVKEKGSLNGFLDKFEFSLSLL